MNFMRSMKSEKVVVQNDGMIDPLSMFAQEEEEKQREAISSATSDPEPEDVSEPSEMYGMYDVPSIEDYCSLLSNERTLMKLPDLLIQLSPGRLVPGTLFMTTYRMAFLPSRAHLASLAASNPTVYSMLNVPLSCIDKIEREKKDAKTVGRTIIVSCKDARQHKIFLQAKNSDPSCTDNVLLSDAEIDRALSAMCTYAFPNDIKFLFAFQHSFPPPGVPRLPPFDMMEEFTRLGVTDVNILGGANWWRVTTINDKYRLCNTYPRVLVVPSKITDEELFSVAGFRSGQRLPVMSWVSRDNGASIWRSAQPKSGVSGSCSQDEALLDCIAHSCAARISPKGLITTTGKPLLHILDCRPRTSAMANRAAGAGYENSANYPNTKLDFMNIGNIHVMRESLRSLTALFSNSIDNPSNDCSFGKAVEDTGWLTHVRLVLRCSWECARLVQRGIPVLVHCSHGWDRTSQVVAIAQIMLDPFYRTFDGFRVLVEKDWLCAGHPFQWRCGHGFDKTTRHDDETSPIFLQFLDCVQQLVRLYPHYFEYSPRYLLAIADNLFNCRFGTFLGLCEADRDLNETRTKCPDLWTYLHYNRTSLCSPFYLDPMSEDTPTTHIFLPPLAKILRNVSLWGEYFHRWSAVPTVVTPPEHISNLLNSNGIFQKPAYRDPYASEYKNAGEDYGDITESLKHPDFDLSSMCCHFDYWDVFYREERCKREALENPEDGLGENGKLGKGRERTASQDITRASSTPITTDLHGGDSHGQATESPILVSSGEGDLVQCRSCNGSGMMSPGPLASVHDEIEVGSCEKEGIASNAVAKESADNTIIIAQQQQVIDRLSRLLIESGQLNAEDVEKIVGSVGV